MKKFKVTITETLSRNIEVQALSQSDAIKIVKDNYQKSDIVLDESDLKATDIDITNSLSKKEDLINSIIEYLYEDEKKHFYESNMTEDHIFLKLKELKKLIC